MKGIEREANLPKSEYFTDEYFSMIQLCSHSHQLHMVHSLNPKSIIEVGIGNGFVSSFLRKSGVPVLTVDINPALEPDICAPLSEVKNLVDKSFDLVICCEVLEHMPLEDLEANLDYLKSLGERLFITLPSSHRTWGVSIMGFLPKFNGRILDLNFRVPWKRSLKNSGHYWEVGYTIDCSKSSILKRLRSRYRNVSSGRYSLNPNHIWFICE